MKRTLRIVGAAGLVLALATTAWSAVELYNLSQNLKARFNAFTSGVSGTGALATVLDRSDKPTYTACSALLTPTGAQTLLSVEAGSAKKTILLRAWVLPGSQTTAAYRQFLLRRITTASSGGTAITPEKHDPADGNFSGRVASAPTPGTAGAQITAVTGFGNTTAAAPDGDGLILYDHTRNAGVGYGKPIIVNSGTTNGVEIRDVAGAAGAANWTACATFSEENQ